MGAKRIGKQNTDGMPPNSSFQAPYNPYASAPPLNSDPMYGNQNLQNQFGGYNNIQPQGKNIITTRETKLFFNKN